MIDFNKFQIKLLQRNLKDEQARIEEVKFQRLIVLRL